MNSPVTTRTEPDADLLRRIETFYDAVPRLGARAEVLGPLVLFVREGAGWPYYARPTSPDVHITELDVRAVRARMSQLAVPHQFEWVHDLTPSLTEAVASNGLPVQRCPLMVLDVDALTVPLVADVEVQLGGPDDDDLAASEAVASVAFGAGIGTRVGEAGLAERAQAEAAQDPARLASRRDGIRRGEQVRAVARTADGPVGSGGYQHAAGVAELVGIATLPAFRRRGIAAALAGVLASAALEDGQHTVFLAAQDEDVARVYERVGFRRLATAGIAEG
ncbi:GNAT family N-acetyltransferase [Angustibacter sp. McL0619]|uniref:GNAT family N-acetyltransferase n=1 Tax=Angustibacter sp. McL0619 TaxID=3415676 RepID=UPI003CEEADA4